MSRYEDYERARNTNIYDVLSMCNIYKEKYNMYKCIFHNDNTPSAYVDFNRMFCHACNNNWSTIDIVMQSQNVSESEAVDMILNLTENSTSIKKEVIHKNDKDKVQDEQKEINENFLKKYKIVKESKKDDFIKYIEEDRKINRRVLKILDENKVVYGTDEYNQPAFVFNDKHCIFRNFKANKNYSLVLKEYSSSYVEIKSNNFPIFTIVEGIYDALTLLDRDTSCNVICLNSVKHTQKLIDDIKSDLSKQKRIYILALDNDIVGKKTTETIVNFFKENNIRYSFFVELIENNNCKDVNELRQKSII